MTETVEDRVATVTLINFIAALTSGLVQKGLLTEADINEYAKTAVAGSRGAEDGAKALLKMTFPSLKLD